MSNTITAYFKGRVGVAESVYQNDYGMVMNFDSIELPAHFDCYFSILNQEEAIPGVGADGMVAIPNSVLANPGTVTIHIPIHTGANDSEVEYIVYFKVIGRARPIDDGTPTQMTAIERALALLSQPITNIEEIVNEALSFTGDTFQEMKEDLQDDIADFKSEVRGDISDVESDFDILQGQFDTAVAALTVDSEVADIRVGADGVTYASAGAAVRGQFHDVKSALTASQLKRNISGNVVLFTDGSGEYDFENTKIAMPYNSEGYSTIVVVNSGKNLMYDDFWELGSYGEYGGKYDNDDDVRTQGIIAVKEGIKYTFSQIYTRGEIAVQFYTDTEFISRVTKRDSKFITFTTPENCTRITLRMTKEEDGTDVENAMLEVGGSASAYVPYIGQKFTTSIGQTIYGGYYLPEDGKVYSVYDSAGEVLETPTEIDVTPITLTTYLGDNTVYATHGSTSTRYISSLSLSDKIIYVDLTYNDLQYVIDHAPDGAFIYCCGVDDSYTLYTLSNKRIHIIGGTFYMTPRVCTSSLDYGVKPIFTVTDGELSLTGCTFIATSYAENPFIYVRSDIDPDGATDSNVEVVSASDSIIKMTECIINNCMGVYAKDSKIVLQGNIAETSMFVFGSTNEVISANNTIEVQDSGLTAYYHVYYLDTYSKLDINQDAINSRGEYFDVIHCGVTPETAGCTAKVNGMRFNGKFNRFSQGTSLNIYMTNSLGHILTPRVYGAAGNRENNIINYGSYMQKSINFLDFQWNEGKNIDANGDLTNDDATDVSELIDVNFKYCRLWLTDTNSYVAFYDENGDYIEKTNNGLMYTLPANASKYRIIQSTGSPYMLFTW